MGLQNAIALDARFELLERVGGGSFGEVFRARDRETGDQVAIKRMHAHLLEPAALRRFAREASMLARIDSAHVVRYVAHGDDASGRPFLATEWLSGEELTRFRARGDTTLSDALASVRDAALGAAALHASGVVHRDLKPSNIFVCTEPDGRRVAKLVDLGIAHVTDATVLTATGMILGSPAYMAPEQVRGEPVDRRADLWALGVVLFELIASEPPFGSANAIAVLGKVLLEPVPELAALRPGLPSALYDLVESLLEKSVELRGDDAQALAARLDALLRDEDSVLRVTRAYAPASPGSSPHDGDPNATQPIGVSERRMVALLFARGEGLEAPSSVATVIGRFGGQVERLRDAWLGGFGLVRARGDELVAAARAALEARRLGARVALVSGWAEVRAASVVAGALIDRGAALLDRADAGEVRVSRDALSRLEGDFVLEAISPTELRLLRERRAEALVGAAPPLLLGRPVPVLGRDKELRLLEGVVLEAVGERAPRVALVVGEAGLGKSRLLFELLARTRAMDPPVFSLVLRAEPVLMDAPHGVVIKGLREAIGLEEGEPAEVSREKLSSVMRRYAYAGPGEDLAILSAFLRIGEGDAAASPLGTAHADPGAHRSRVRAALAGLVRAVCARAPMVLAFEDLHWADRTSLELLVWLVNELASEPLAVIAFARPELTDRHPSLWKGVDRTELRLAPLSPRASEALVAAALQISEAERRALVQRAAGNPLFLQELVRARAEGLQELPAAVHSVLQARLDALGIEARRFAQAASVFGQSFWTEGVSALRPGISVGAALNELSRAELVLARPASRFAGATEYAFNHALVRDAAYAMLVEAERRELHARAADWLTSAGERDPSVLGHHAEMGGRPEQAGASFLSASRAALAQSAFELAEGAASRALSCVREGPLAAEVLLVRAEARRALGRAREMLADARAAHTAAAGDLSFEIRALSRVGEALHVLGDLQGADATLRTVLEESHAALLSPRVQAILQLALVDIDAGRPHEAVVLADEALAWLADAGPEFDHQRLQALRARASALAATFDLPAALTAARGALAAAVAAPNRLRAAEARVTYARVAMLSGRASEAYDEIRTALAEANALQAPILEASARHVLGEVLAERDDVESARAVFARTELDAERVGARRVRVSARAHGLLSALNAGDDASAPGDLVLRAEMVRAECEGFPPLRVLAAVLVGRALLRAGDAEAAVDVLARTDASLRVQSGSGEHDERLRLAHATALDTLGHRVEADRVLHQAYERLLHKAAKWRAPEARAAYLEGVRTNRTLCWLASERLGAR